MGLKTSTKVIGVISCFTGWAGAGGADVCVTHPWSDLGCWPIFLCGGMAHVVIAIKKDFEVLSSSNASQAKKLGSLKFLGHWVGDIHQPLHVSFEDDRGGNNVLVTGECGSNLQSAWDTCLVLKAVGEDVGEAATELMKRSRRPRSRAGPIRIRRTGQTNLSPSRKRRKRRTACNRTRRVTTHRGR